MNHTILIILLMVSCTSWANEALDQCVKDQTELYGDLCGEAYDYMDPQEAHYQGVKCGAMGVKYCLEGRK